MHNPFVVCLAEGVGSFNPNCQQFPYGQWPLAQPCRQGLALQVLHYQEADPRMFTNVVERTNVGVGNRRESARFSLKARAEFGVMNQMGRKGLDRHYAIKTRIERPIHLAHTAGSQSSG